MFPLDVWIGTSDPVVLVARMLGTVGRVKFGERHRGELRHCG